MSTSVPIPTFLRELPLARRALQHAGALHLGQRRVVDGAPFVVHPLEVASLLHNTGHSEQILAAAILHDAVEDTSAEIDDIARDFGERIAWLVDSLTEDPTIDGYVQRKAALRKQIARAGADAAAIYAADKVAKVRELRAQAACDPVLLEQANRQVRDRILHYELSLGVLEDVIPRHPLVRQLRFELEVLAWLPPRGD